MDHQALEDILKKVETLRTVTVPESVVGERQSHLEAGPAERCRADDDAAVVRDDDLEDQRKAKSGAGGFGGEKRSEDAIARGWFDPGPVVVDADAADALRVIDLRINAHLRRNARCGTRIDGVAQQVAERLAQQHIVAVDRSELARDDDV